MGWRHFAERGPRRFQLQATVKDGPGKTRHPLIRHVITTSYGEGVEVAGGARDKAYRNRKIGARLFIFQRPHPPTVQYHLRPKSSNNSASTRAANSDSPSR